MTGGDDHRIDTVLASLGFAERGLYGEPRQTGQPIILVCRDPNDNSGHEHQYLVWKRVAWHRHVPDGADPHTGWDLYDAPRSHRSEVIDWLVSRGWDRDAQPSTAPIPV